MADENNLHFLTKCGFYYGICKDSDSSRSLFQSAVQSTKSHPLSSMLVKYLGHVLCHRDHWQMPAKCFESDRKTEPAIHKDVICLYPPFQSSFHHCLKVLGDFFHSFLPPFITTSPLIQLFGDSLHTFSGFGRRRQYKVNRQEVDTIRPPQCKHFEDFQATMCIMVMYPGQQFNCLGTITVISAVVKDKDLFLFLVSQGAEKPDDTYNQRKQEVSPVMPRSSEQYISGIFPRLQLGISDDTPGKVYPL